MEKNPVNCVVGVLFAFTVLAASGVFAAEKMASLPKNFRSWTHTKSTVIADKSHPLYGFHNQYANVGALKTLKSGGTYKDGAVFVDSLHEVEVKDGIQTVGKKMAALVMIKDMKADKTGGWIFAKFGPDGKAMQIDQVKDCFECHTPVKDSDFVFQKYID